MAAACQALTLPRPAGPARLRDSHLRLSAPHAPDRPEGGHSAGQGRPGDRDREQGQPLQPTLPGGDAHPTCPCPARPARARPGPRLTFSSQHHPPSHAHFLVLMASWPEASLSHSGIPQVVGWQGGALGLQDSEVSPRPCPSPPSALPTPGDPHVEEGRVCLPGECLVQGRRPRWGEGRKDGEGRGRGRPSKTSSETPRGCTGGPWRGQDQRALGVTGLLLPDQRTTDPRASGRDEGRER